MNSKTASNERAGRHEVQYFGFRCRVVSSEWAELFERDRLERAMSVEERMDSFLRTLNEIRGLPCSR
jgi:phosphoribulokinase